MPDAPRVVVRTRSEISSDEARDARARGWAFIFDCHAKKNAAGCDQHRDGDEAKKGSQHEVRPTDIIPR